MPSLIEPLILEKYHHKMNHIRTILHLPGLCILAVEELVVASPTPVLLSGCLLPEECHGNNSIVAATCPLHRLQADQCNLQE